ncbi:MAG: TetR family transcriptional regulator [Gammaproteobacteria bacterium]
MKAANSEQAGRAGKARKRRATPAAGISDQASARPAAAQGRTSESAGNGGGQERALGRPPARDGDQVKNLLLTAARKLFLNYEFKAVSVRQIAALAGVNGAMINYYFGGKKGLYLAMVDEVFRTLEQPLNELNAQHHDSVRDFIGAYMAFLASNPWWPNFIIREVLFGEKDIRQSIIEKFSATFARQLIRAVGSEIDRGHYRADLRPEFATWSLMGMMVFPFLTRPIAGQLLDNNLLGEGEESREFMAQLITHTGELFEQGVLRQEKT